MINIHSRHLLTGAELSSSEIYNILILSEALKQDRAQGKLSSVLQGKHLAMLFDKPSLRTRMSFIVAMQELGGHIVESVVTTRKQEDPEDQLRVIEGYCHGIMIRTHKDSDIERMASIATIPIINALSDNYHPCQTLADLMTLRERFSTLAGVRIAYIGDGNNVLHSLLLMAPLMGVTVHYCCPPGFEPQAEIVEKAKQRCQPTASIKSFSKPQEAAKLCDAIYTDVWTSMGFAPRDEHIFEGFQVNEALMRQANPHAIFMHCMPIERGKEVSQTLPDAPCSAVFQQSENRLHVQKALLIGLLS